jgi:hypothetical protein
VIFIILFLVKNHDVYQQNILKRTYNSGPILLYNILLIVDIYLVNIYIDISGGFYKIILATFMSILLIYDFYVYMPYNNV